MKVSQDIVIEVDRRAQLRIFLPDIDAHLADGAKRHIGDAFAESWIFLLEGETVFALIGNNSLSRIRAVENVRSECRSLEAPHGIVLVPMAVAFADQSPPDITDTVHAIFTWQEELAN